MLLSLLEMHWIDWLHVVYFQPWLRSESGWRAGHRLLRPLPASEIWLVDAIQGSIFRAEGVQSVCLMMTAGQICTQIIAALSYVVVMTVTFLLLAVAHLPSFSHKAMNVCLGLFYCSTCGTWVFLAQKCRPLFSRLCVAKKMTV